MQALPSGPNIRKRYTRIVRPEQEHGTATRYPAQPSRHGVPLKDALARDEGARRGTLRKLLVRLVRHADPESVRLILEGFICPRDTLVDIDAQRVASALLARKTREEILDFRLGGTVQRRRIDIPMQEIRREHREAARRNDGRRIRLRGRRRKIGDDTQPIQLGRKPSGIWRPSALYRQNTLRTIGTKHVARTAVPPIAAQIPVAGDAGERTAVFELLCPMSVDEGALGVPIRQKNIAELDRQQDRPPDPRDDRFEAPSKRRMATKIFLRPRIFATDARTVSPGGMGGRLWIGRRLGPSPLRRKDPKTRRT